MCQDMAEFCRRAKIDLEKASAGNPQSNGAAEAGVKQAKGIFMKARMEGCSQEEALFMMQATPRAPGSLSPMRLFHGREVRIPQLPALSDLRDKAACASTLNQNKLDKKTWENLKVEQFDTSPMDLKIGLEVAMMNPKSNLWDIKGTVVNIQPGGRSCYVKTATSNRTYLCNRRLLHVNRTQLETKAECFEI